MGKITKAFEILKNDGLRGVIDKLRGRQDSHKQANIYQKWIREFDTLTENDRKLIRQEIENLTDKSLISIVMPVYNVEEKWLRLCLDSVIHQLYTNWELCIADDFSSKPHIRQILKEYSAKDSRIKIIFRTENGNISAASNSALELAAGKFVALLDNDDELSETALFYVVKEINKFPKVDLIYSDEDKIDENNQRSNPTRKPNWDADLFHSMNYLNHLTVYRTSILREIGGFRIGFEGSQDYDLALRVIEKISPENVRHIPQILYHWRTIPGSIALDSEGKIYAHEIARKALREYFERKNIKVIVKKGFENYHRIKFEIPENVTTEIIQIEKLTAENYNLQAKNSTKDILIFVHKSLHNINKEAFTELASLALRKEIGAVGGKILNADGTIYNCGIWLNEKVEFINQGLPKDYAGNLASGQVVQNVDAVCEVLAVRREIFEKMNGFDVSKTEFEIDFCQRLREQNYQILFTPYAEFRKN